VVFNTNLIFSVQKPYNASMWYVEVLVADATFHRDEALTYSSNETLAAGRVVVVPVRKKEVMGVVVGTVPKPSFAAKPIISAPSLPPLPLQQLALIGWIREYYPAPLGMTLQLFLA
jgi:primosomal protein N' (replication factor Y) (superfamily II helicase)